jgi:ADP-heptose:LPS heptosyltransferase
LHPKTRGSSKEWDLKNYLKLIELLPKDKFKIFVTGTAEEGQAMKTELLDKNPDVTDATGKFEFEQFLAFLNKVDGIVAPSTGPLHIAAALGKLAIGLYPSIRPMDRQRWAPLGPKATYLALEGYCSQCKKQNYCECVNSISPEQVKETLIKLRGNT